MYGVARQYRCEVLLKQETALTDALLGRFLVFCIKKNDFIQKCQFNSIQFNAIIVLIITYYYQDTYLKMDLFNHSNPTNAKLVKPINNKNHIRTLYKDFLVLFIEKNNEEKIYQSDMEQMNAAIDILNGEVMNKYVYFPYLIILEQWLEIWQREIKRARVHKWVYSLSKDNEDIIKLKQEIEQIRLNEDYISKYFYTKDISVQNISKIFDIMLVQKSDFGYMYLNDYNLLVESDLENYVSSFLKNIFGDIVNTQYSVGGKPRMIIDIDFGNGQLGVELKVANELDKSEKLHRFIGQGVYYSKRVYNKNNFIALVVGRDKENYIISELQNIFQSLNITFIYKEAY